jgi:hypothetical protein
MSRFFHCGHPAAFSLLVAAAALATPILPTPTRAEEPSAPVATPEPDRHPDLRRLSTTDDILIRAKSNLDSTSSASVADA